MGQQEVFDYLKKNKPNSFSAKEISKEIKISISSVTMSLKKLRERNTIKYKEGFTFAPDGSPRRCLKYNL